MSIATDGSMMVTLIAVPGWRDGLIAGAAVAARSMNANVIASSAKHAKHAKHNAIVQQDGPSHKSHTRVTRRAELTRTTIGQALEVGFGRRGGKYACSLKLVEGGRDARPDE